MSKARKVPRPLVSLLAIATLALTASVASAQTANSVCSLPTAEISRISRPTGVLRADPDANNTTSQKIAADVQRVCTTWSDRSALGQVHIKIADNNIILTGVVPAIADEQQLLDIATANADGRTVFNRLELVPLQMANQRRQ